MSVAPDSQEQFDDAMFAFSMGDYDTCITKLQALLETEPEHFDAQLALGMAYYRKGDFPTAIAEGHKAEKLRPQEQLVHTNLSLFYMKAGDKAAAEHHGLQARIVSWRGNMASPGSKSSEASELAMAQPPPSPKPPLKPRDMPWKKKTAPLPSDTPSAQPDAAEEPPIASRQTKNPSADSGRS
jgi:tetratricopeptide (TPR) repeat protein